MKEITIFTPTHNRKNYLKKLYNSLIKQTNKNFIWLVIDDGSTDETNNLLLEYKKENIIEINYIYKKNGGKYTAINLANELCNTKYICCVDSDDTLLDEAIEIMSREIHKYSNKIGIFFPRNNKININNADMDIMDLKFKYNNTETTILIKTEVAIKYPFTIDENEKFASEEIIYNMYAKDGKLRFIDSPIVLSSYLSDGLTNNIYNLWRNNPNNSILLFKSRFNFVRKYNPIKRILLRCKCIINYILTIYKNEKINLKNTPKINKFYYYPLYPLGIIYFKIKVGDKNESFNYNPFL